MPLRVSACGTRCSITCQMWSTSRRVPWKALFAVTAPSTSQMGRIPRSRAASALSTTSAAAPMPMIMPWRRRSNGMAASSTTSSVAAAPLARKPGAEPLDQMVGCDVVRRDHDHAAAPPGADPVLGHGDACVVLAQAALICVLGPRAPMNSANCEWPMDKTRNRKRRSNAIRVPCRWRRAIRRCAGRSPAAESAGRWLAPARAGPPARPAGRGGRGPRSNAPSRRRTSR